MGGQTKLGFQVLWFESCRWIWKLVDSTDNYQWWYFIFFASNYTKEKTMCLIVSSLTSPKKVKYKLLVFNLILCVDNDIYNKYL